MKRFKKIGILFLSLLSLCLFMSCELIYEQTPGRIILIGVGLDYMNSDGSSETFLDDNEGLPNPPNDIRELAYVFSHFASESNKEFIYIPMIQQYMINSIPPSNYPNKSNLEALFLDLLNNDDIDAKVYDGDFDEDDYTLESEYSTFGSEVSSIDPISENDILIFYYSGHGNESDDGALRLPKDADEQDRESIELSWFYNYFSLFDCKVLVVLDSCGSGSFIMDSNSTVNTITTSFVDTLPSLYDKYFTYKNDNIVINDIYAMASTRPDELSFDTRTLGVNHPNSIFSYYFLRALGYENNSDVKIGSINDKISALENGKITIDNIYEYIYDNISRQEPLIKGDRKSLVLFTIN